MSGAHKPPKMIKYCFDIDGTLCTNTDGDYEQAQPFFDAINDVNRLFDSGHDIFLYTARGTTTGIDWRGVTEKQLAGWGVRYHQLFLGKPTADIYIDDKARNAADWHAELRARGETNLKESSKATNTSILARGEYLETTYSAQRKPYGKYPAQLGRWLLDGAYGKPGRLLDVGCGRGDFLSAFRDLGFDVAGIDISPSAQKMAGPDIQVELANLETDPLPFPSESFDFIFSKSVIEHSREPTLILSKAFEALRPGGLAVIMTPSWSHNHWGPFYLDHTHVTPFTRPSLSDAMSYVGFEEIRVSHFYQLPFVWKFPVLMPVCWLLNFLKLPYRPMHNVKWGNGINKTIRFSREVMLLAVGRKPVD